MSLVPCCCSLPESSYLPLFFPVLIDCFIYIICGKLYHYIDVVNCCQFTIFCVYLFIKKSPEIAFNLTFWLLWKLARGNFREQEK